MKKTALMSVMLVLLLIVAACGGNNATNIETEATTTAPTEKTPEKESAVTPPAENVALSFMHWRTEDKAVFDKLIADFEAENPNIKVTQTIFPSSDYTSVAQQKLLDGTTGDVFTVFPGSQFKGLTDAGLMEDLSGKPVVENFVPTLITRGAVEGKQYALPYQLVYNMPLINVGIFEKLGISMPTDWDSYVAALETLKSNGYIPIALPGADIGRGQLMNPMLMNENTDEEMFPKLVTKDTKLTDEWYVNSLEKWNQLTPYFQDNSLGTKYDAAVTLFVTEKAAMPATGSFHAALVLEQAPDMKLDMLPPITVPASDVVFEGLRVAEVVDHHRVVDDQVDGVQRVDLGRVGAQRHHGVAHGGQVDDGRNAGEVLHQHAGRAEADFVFDAALVVEPVGHGLQVGFVDGDAVFVAQQVLQQHLHRDRQLAGAVQTRFLSGAKAVIDVGLAADDEFAAGFEAVYRRHFEGSLLCPRPPENLSRDRAIEADPQRPSSRRVRPIQCGG